MDKGFATLGIAALVFIGWGFLTMDHKGPCSDCAERPRGAAATVTAGK